MTLKPIYRPTELEVRITRHFAFLPTELADGRRVWLQRYYLKMRYESNGYYEDYFDRQRRFKQDGKRPMPPPMKTFGSYAYGGHWVDKGRYLNRWEVPVSEWDNNPDGHVKVWPNPITSLP